MPLSPPALAAAFEPPLPVVSPPPACQPLSRSTSRASSDGWSDGPDDADEAGQVADSASAQPAPATQPAMPANRRLTAEKCSALAGLVAREVEVCGHDAGQRLRAQMPKIGADLRAGARTTASAGYAAAAACWQAAACGLGHAQVVGPSLLCILAGWGASLTKPPARGAAWLVGLSLGQQNFYRLAGYVSEWAAWAANRR